MTATAPTPTASPSPFIKWFRELSIGDIPLVGVAGAELFTGNNLLVMA